MRSLSLIFLGVPDPSLPAPSNCAGVFPCALQCFDVCKHQYELRVGLVTVSSEAGGHVMRLPLSTHTRRSRCWAMSSCSSNPSAAFFDCPCGSSVTRNYFNLTEFACASSFFHGSPSLPESAGYLVIVGLGLLFALLCMAISTFDYKYLGTKNTSEHFNSIGRSVRVGVTATDIVSKATWASSLLQSANVAYK